MTENSFKQTFQKKRPFERVILKHSLFGEVIPYGMGDFCLFLDPGSDVIPSISQCEFLVFKIVHGKILWAKRNL